MFTIVTASFASSDSVGSILLIRDISDISSRAKNSSGVEKLVSPNTLSAAFISLINITSTLRTVL